MKGRPIKSRPNNLRSSMKVETHVRLFEDSKPSVVNKERQDMVNKRQFLKEIRYQRRSSIFQNRHSVFGTTTLAPSVKRDSLSVNFWDNK